MGGGEAPNHCHSVTARSEPCASISMDSNSFFGAVPARVVSVAVPKASMPHLDFNVASDFAVSAVVPKVSIPHLDFDVASDRIVGVAAPLASVGQRAKH